ncbi:MAG TPA: hypothetical protein VLB27_08655 [candidate division Zixibacteria bacterium]|nr:hypothetical protein [candidate division Zixibacteria bacterium]
MDLLDANDNPIAVGRRLSPGMTPIPAGITGGPRGTFYVDGKLDPYSREDLGQSLNLIYVTEAEIAAIESEDAESVDVVLT